MTVTATFTTESIPCPGGCGSTIHPSATSCYACLFKGATPVFIDGDTAPRPACECGADVEQMFRQTGSAKGSGWFFLTQCFPCRVPAPTCACGGPIASTYDDGNGEAWHTRCGTCRDFSGFAFINAYGTDRAYGGPEEGGWWYTYGIPHASIPVRAHVEHMRGRLGCKTRAALVAKGFRLKYLT